jgi:hypothetical protein
MMKMGGESGNVALTVSETHPPYFSRHGFLQY